MRNIFFWPRMVPSQWEVPRNAWGEHEWRERIIHFSNTTLTRWQFKINLILISIQNSKDKSQWSQFFWFFLILCWVLFPESGNDWWGVSGPGSGYWSHQPTVSSTSCHIDQKNLQFMSTICWLTDCRAAWYQFPSTDCWLYFLSGSVGPGLEMGVVRPAPHWPSLSPHKPDVIQSVNSGESYKSSSPVWSVRWSHVDPISPPHTQILHTGPDHTLLGSSSGPQCQHVRHNSQASAGACRPHHQHGQHWGSPPDLPPEGQRREDGAYHPEGGNKPRPGGYGEVRDAETGDTLQLE